MFQEVTITILLILSVIVLRHHSLYCYCCILRIRIRDNILFCAISPYLVVCDMYLKWLVRNSDSICLMEIIRVKGLS